MEKFGVYTFGVKATLPRGDKSTIMCSTKLAANRKFISVFEIMSMHSNGIRSIIKKHSLFLVIQFERIDYLKQNPFQIY